MNSLKGVIEQIDINGNLSLVSLKVGECYFKSIVIETPDSVDYLKVGNTVDVLFKETEVIIGRGENMQISLRNRMNATITSVDKGKLLARIIMKTNAGEVISIITSNAVEQLGLVEDAQVLAMVKTNEIMLAKC
ncbi:MAG: TOBE domain-containing protein [Bacteroidota bacterium]